MYILSVRSIAIFRELNIIVFTNRIYSVSENILIFLSEIYLSKETYHAQEGSLTISHNMNKYIFTETEDLRVLSTWS